MTRMMSRVVLAIAMSAAALAPLPAAAQQARAAAGAAPQAASTIGAPAATARQDFVTIRWPRTIRRFWQDFTLPAGESARRVLLFSGTATIDGEVERDLVVLLGDVRLGPSALVRDSIFVLGGKVTVAEGAQVWRDLIIVGGTVDAPPTFNAGGEHFIIGSPRLGAHLHEFLRWVTWGLLWGRIIVFSIEWVWWVLAVVFVFSLVLNVVFQQPVRAAAEVVLSRPLNALLMGALLFVITGPLIVLIGGTVIGLLVVPFVVCAVFLAWSIGKVGVMRAVGMSVLGDTDPDSRFQAIAAFLIGFLLITLLYAVPVLGFVAWSLVALFGLGAAGLTFASRLRREYPRREKTKKGARPEMEPAPGFAPAAMPMEMHAPALAVSVGAPPVTPVAPPSATTAAEPPAVAVGATLLPHAAFLDRAAAFAIDVILVAIITQFFDEVGLLGIHGDMVPLMLLIYHVAFWSWKSTTLGGIICRLRVVRTTGEPIRPIDTVVRGLTGILSIAALGIGCLWMLQDANRQTWHDKVAGTYVVKVPKDWPLE